MIELENIGKKYGRRILFDNVNIKIKASGLYCIVGDNGSGKTTLLNIIGGFIKSSCGRVVNKVGRCSFVSQKVNLLEGLTIREHFKMFGLDINLLRRVNLYSKNRYPGELSFGMRQRIAVLIGLHNNCPLVICDEPTSHLDKYNANILMREIKNVSYSKVIFLVSHDREVVNKYSDETYEISNKKISIIKTNDNVKKIQKKQKDKYSFKRYLMFKLKMEKKIKLIFFVIIFFLSFMFNLVVNLKDNFAMCLSEEGVLDYNKFYLKECNKMDNGNVSFKQCQNLSDDNVNLLNQSEHKLSLNYDVLLNNLYNVNYFNVVYNSSYTLKEGKYPTAYNEVMTNGNYDLGDEICLEVNEILRGEKIDIYKKNICFKVVGITRKMPFVEEDKVYVDHNLVEDYMKHECLKNNKISLYEYFQNLTFNDYKYVIYFNDVELSLLNDNNIEYLSSSYEYYNELQDAFEDVIEILNYLNVFIGASVAFYLYKLIKKMVVNKEQDIIFFKASGVKKNRIIKLLWNEWFVLIGVAIIISISVVYFIINLIFEECAINYLFFCLLSLIIFNFSKDILKREIKRRISI